MSPLVARTTAGLRNRCSSGVKGMAYRGIGAREHSVLLNVQTQRRMAAIASLPAERDIVPVALGILQAYAARSYVSTREPPISTTRRPGSMPVARGSFVRCSDGNLTQDEPNRPAATSVVPGPERREP